MRTRFRVLQNHDVECLPGVDAVQRDGDRIRVVGTSQLIAPVCAAVLGDDQLGPPDLRVHHPDLEDALVALITNPDTGRESAPAHVTPEGVS